MAEQDNETEEGLEDEPEVVEEQESAGVRIDPANVVDYRRTVLLLLNEMNQSLHRLVEAQEDGEP